MSRGKLIGAKADGNCALCPLIDDHFWTNFIVVVVVLEAGILFQCLTMDFTVNTIDSISPVASGFLMDMEVQICEPVEMSLTEMMQLVCH